MAFSDSQSAPLYDLTRPRCLDEYIGQNHLVDPEKGSVRNFMRLGYLPSMILHGPPGVGKTSLARILSQEIGYIFLELNATSVTVADLKEIELVINTENVRRPTNPLKIVVFIDEIHRFTTLQQDNLLPYVESGKFVFIGATLVAPETRIRRAILSRCQLFQLRLLNHDNLIQIIQRALEYENKRRHNVKAGHIQLSQAALKVLASTSNGDARDVIKTVEFMSATVGHRAENSFIDEMQVQSILDIRRLNTLNESSTILLTRLYDSMYNIGYNKSAGAQTIFPSDNTLKNRNNEIKSQLDDIKTQADDIETQPDAINTQADEVKTQIDYPNSKSDLDRTKRSYEQHAIEFQLKKQKLWQSFPSLHHYTEEEIEFKIEYSDDSDFESQMPMELDEDIPKFPKPNILERFVNLSKDCIRKLIANGESEVFVLKKLLLFCCLYVEVNSVTLPEFVSCFRSFRYASVNKIKILEELATKLTLSKKKSITKRLEDPIWNLKLMKSHFRNKQYGDHAEDTIEPVVLFESFDLKEYFSSTTKKPKQFYKDLIISEYKLEDARLWSEK